MTYKDRLRHVGLFSLEKTRQRENLIAIHSSLMGKYIFGRARQISIRSKGGVCVCVDKCITPRIKHWSRFSRELFESPSLEIFSTRLHKALATKSNCEAVSALNRGLDKMITGHTLPQLFLNSTHKD